MFASKSPSLSTKLIIPNPQSILDPIEQMRHKKSDINWVRFGYNDKSELVLFGTGTGGFEELTSHFHDDEVCYAVVEVMVKGDAYNPIKFVLVTWIGSKVTPGLGKARCAGHRQQLYDFVNTKVAIAGEFQPSSRSDLTTKDLADKLTRVSRHDTTIPDSQKYVMSRASVNAGDTSKSQAKLANKDEIVDALKRLHKGECTWVTLGYLEGSKDEIGYIKSGSGLESLKEEFPKDKIVYAVVAQQVTETTTTTTKYLLATMVGEKTGPLAKARSGTHRAELADLIKTIMPFHSHYQAAAPADLVEAKLKEKLRA